MPPLSPHPPLISIQPNSIQSADLIGIRVKLSSRRLCVSVLARLIGKIIRFLFWPFEHSRSLVFHIKTNRICDYGGYAGCAEPVCAFLAVNEELYRFLSRC